MEWISIEDQLPEMGIPVLAWSESIDSQGIYICKYKESRDNWKFKKEKVFINIMARYPFSCKDVTHWMYLPQSPFKDERNNR